jgi:hydroxymethylbilane synthase
MKVKIGTRGSKLALWQAEHVAARLKEVGVGSEIIIIDTKGDQILNQSLSEIGSKGLFTEELEEQLFDGRIDIAVHSAKDLQTHLKEGLYVLAITEREQVNDVLVSRKSIDLNEINQPLIIGTSSTRRRAFLRHYFPNIHMVDMRGNLQTRIRKMDEGVCDALLLAYAGVHRMGYHDMIVHTFPEEQFTPAVGQGTLAIEAANRLSNEMISKIREALNHTETEICVQAERSFLKTMEGGCSVPVFALATNKGGDTFELNAGIVSLDGKQLIRKSIIFTKNTNELSGTQLANELLASGAKEILYEIKNTLKK